LIGLIPQTVKPFPSILIQTQFESEQSHEAIGSSFGSEAVLKDH